MQIIFTKSNLIASRIIRAVTGEPVSHCGISVGGFVVHSNFLGVSILSLTKFKQQSTIVYSVDIPYNTNRLLITMSKELDKSYDYGAFFYLGIKLILGKLGISISKKNLWQTTGMYLCTEFISQIINQQEDSMITPYQLYKKLRSK